MTATGPSPHLGWAELACRDGTPYPIPWRVTRAVVLAAEFEQVRAVVGAPIRIGSAYRTPAWNRQVGGARASQHVEGCALDLYPPDGWTVERFYQVIRAVAANPQSAIYGLGRYATFVHLDTRPPAEPDRLVVWHGSRTAAEVKEQIG